MLTRHWNKFRKLGPAETFCRSLHRIRVASVCHTFNVYVFDFRDLKESNVREGTELREISAEDLSRLNFAEGLHPVGHLNRHLNQGYRIFAAIQNGLVISVNGAHLNKMFLSYLRRPDIPVPDRYVYFNLAVTAPAFRRRGMATALRNYMVEQLLKEGYRNAVLVSFPDELAANQWHVAYGCRKWSQMTYMKIGAKEIWWNRLTAFGRTCPGLLTDMKKGRVSQQDTSGHYEEPGKNDWGGEVICK